MCETVIMTDHLAQPPPSEDEISELVQQELGDDVIALETLRSGAWSSAVAVSTPSGHYIVRFAATPDDFYCDAHASQYASDDLPIPRFHGIGQLDKRFWCISDRMVGVHLDELSNEQWKQTLPSVARMLIAMREVDTSGTFGYGGWDRNGNGTFASFADQLLDVGNDVPGSRGGGWRPYLDQHEFARRVFDDGLVKLREHCRFLSVERHLIHEDTLNYNVVVHNNRISGVFDWGTAMWGDAIYDLAWFRFWNPWYPQWAELDIPGYLEREVGVNGAHRDERMHCCLLHIGLMHIRYFAFLGNLDDMNDVARETGKLL